MERKHNLVQMPKPAEFDAEYQGEDWDPGDIGGCDLEIVRFEYEVAWYWYQFAGYEGTGAILFRISRDRDEYLSWGLGHNSCEGPLDGLPAAPETETLAEVWAGWPERDRWSIKGLLEAAGFAFPEEENPDA